MSDVPDPDLSREPPTTWSGVLRQLGPGLIIAAAIVGSGELIATTLTGATAGISLLWLIIVGCVVKVFVQIELGRATIIQGKPTLSALVEVPGPRVRGRGNWLVWYWLAMWLCSISQLGGIVGGCGQALALVAPLTDRGAAQIAANDVEIQQQLAENLPNYKIEPLEPARDGLNLDPTSPAGRPLDDRLWCIPIAIATSFLLLKGRYGTIQSVSTVLVALFTLVTIWNVTAIQISDDLAITGAEFMQGLSFGLPETGDTTRAIAAALSTIGIIGVGAAELIQYPYWCLEKGYARWTGQRDDSASWNRRAAGWLRVMRTDAWTSMVIYTFATIAFFLLGVAILHRAGLVPEKDKLLQTLLTMYTPVFGSWASPIFIVGAIVVLYSTYFVGNASHARTFTDALVVTGVIENSPANIARWIGRLNFLFPLLCLAIYWFIPEPTLLVLISGAAQTLMLPMLGFAALYFRYRRTPEALKPSRIWDVGLWLSMAVMTILAAWGLFEFVRKLF